MHTEFLVGYGAYQLEIVLIPLKIYVHLLCYSFRFKLETKYQFLLTLYVLEKCPLWMDEFTFTLNLILLLLVLSKL